MLFKKLQGGSTIGQSWSNTVKDGDFDRNWSIASGPAGFIIYTAAKNGSVAFIELINGQKYKLQFKKGKRIWLGTGGVAIFDTPGKVSAL
ncbi:hypothetical protein M3223_10930 [Paenibacillus pasadenensis]|uniref:hypothetical protein n=1 Tax=Paenibacillus pasadenensis TaxID=217090 RepID=UPI00203A39F0|nr:hypothetical protein [Paenibacillus pasadenensis]MCM3747865.1 hypothetical protein [Paenibacillus pasadenensis]